VGPQRHWCVVYLEFRHGLLSFCSHSAPLGSDVALVHDLAEEDPTPRPASTINYNEHPILTFNKDTGWITKRSDTSLPTVNLCWIPQLRRGDHYAVYRGSKVVIGSSWGAITIINLSPVLKS
jgi:hypothetical protein